MCQFESNYLKLCTHPVSFCFCPIRFWQLKRFLGFPNLWFLKVEAFMLLEKVNTHLLFSGISFFIVWMPTSFSMTWERYISRQMIVWTLKQTWNNLHIRNYTKKKNDQPKTIASSPYKHYLLTILVLNITLPLRLGLFGFQNQRVHLVCKSHKPLLWFL